MERAAKQAIEIREVSKEQKLQYGKPTIVAEDHSECSQHTVESLHVSEIVIF